MHKRRIGGMLVLAALLLSALPGHAQVAEDRKDPVRNVVYGELAGNGIFWSLNYERRFAEQWYGRLGVSFLGDGGFVGPVMANYLTGRGSHHLELGGGVLLATGANTDVAGDVSISSSVVPTWTVGYRYQPPRGGVVFKIGLTPVLVIVPWAGISLGVAF